MKKMIAMLCAIATGFFAFGDAEVNTLTRFSGVNFEEAQGYHAGDLIANETSDNGGWYWFLDEGADEESGTVKAIEVEEGVTNQYLEVETGAVPLYRTVDNKTSAATMTFDTLPTVDIDTGIFFDADVKFTPGAEAPTLAEGAKFAVWALETEPETEGDPMTTNLMVTAGQKTEDGIVPVTFTLATPANFDFAAWHRLTIRAIKEVTKAGDLVSGFVVFVDGVEGTKGVPLAATDTDYATKVGYSADDLNNGPAKFFNAKQLFLSAGTMSEEANQSLKVMGLQGSGAIDNFQITDYENAPIFARDEIQVTVNFDADAVSTFKMMIGDVEIPAAKIDKTVEGKWVATVDGMTPAVIVSDIELSDTTKMVTNYDEDEEFITIEGAALESPTANRIVTETIGFVVDEKNYPAGETGFAAALAAAQLANVPLVLKADFTMNMDTIFAEGLAIEGATEIDLAGNNILLMGTKAGGQYEAPAFYVADGGSLKIIDSIGGGAVMPAVDSTFDGAVAYVGEGGEFVLGEDGTGDAGATIDGTIYAEGGVTLYKGLVSKANETIPAAWLAEDHDIEDDTEAHTGFWKIISLAPEFEVVVPEIDVEGVSFESITADGVAEETPAAGTKTARDSVVVVYALADGYELAEDSAELTQQFTAADTAVTPTAQKIVYTLTLTPGENATLTPSAEGPYYYNDTITITAAPESTDYEFTEQAEGWTLNDGVQTKSVTFTDNVTVEGPAATAIDWAASIVIGGVTQKFRTEAEALAAVQAAEQDPTKLPITVNVIKATANFAAGSTIIIDATGWAITGNTILATDIVAGKAVTVDGALTYSGTVYGSLTATTITIPEDGEIVLVEGGEIVTTTADLAITVDAANGYELKESEPVEDYITYTAELKTVEVTFAAPDATEGTWPEVKEVEYGTAWTAVELPADPVKEGWTFTGWADAPETVTEDVTVTAQFSQDAVTFTVKEIEGATLTKVEKFVDPDWVDITAGPFSVAPGTQVKLTYEADEGYDLTAETFTTTVSEAGEIDASGTILPVPKTYVAQIGDDQYETLAEAFAEVEDGETIELLANYTLPATIANTKQVTLDLGGNTLTASDAAYLSNTGDFTVTNGVITSIGMALYNDAPGTLTLDNEIVITTGNHIYNETGATLVIGATAEINGTDVQPLIESYGDTDIYGTVIANNTAACELPVIWFGCATLNLYEGCVLESTNGDIVRCNDSESIINVHGGTLQTVGEFPVIYVYGGAAVASTEVNITGGVIGGVLDIAAGSAFALGEGCNAVFSKKGTEGDPNRLERYVADGYETAQITEGDYTGYWQIRIKEFAVTFADATDGSATIEPAAGTSNLVYGTELTITATAADGYEYSADVDTGWEFVNATTVKTNVTITADATFTAPAAIEPTEYVTFTVKAIEGATLTSVATNAGEDVWVTIAEPYTVEKGASVKLTFAPAKGYTLETTTATVTVEAAGEVDASGTITPSKMGFAIIIAETTTNYYPTLAAAFGEVADGGTVTLLDNATLATATTLNKETTTGITLDLNEKTLTGSVANALVISGATTKFTIANGRYVSNGDNALKAANGAEVTIAANATITGSQSVQAHAAAVLNVYGEVSLEDAIINYCYTVNVYDGATIGIVGSETTGVYLIALNADHPTLNVYGGVIEATYAIHAYDAQSQINFVGGTIKGYLQDCGFLNGTLTDECKTLFTVKEWEGDPSKYSVEALAAANYKAKQVEGGWQIVEKDKFTVTFMVGDQQYGEVQNVYEGAKATKPEVDPTKEHYSFDGWFKTGATDAFDFDTAITENITLNAEFTEDAKFTVTLDFDADKVENVTVNGDAYTVAVELYSNTTVTVAATAKTGYKDVTFAVNGAEAAAAPCQFTLEKNSTVVIAATKDEPAYPEYIDPTDTDLAAEYNVWKAQYGDDTGSVNEEAFLLNCDPKNVETAKANFKFTEITVDSAGNVTFKIATKTPEGDKLDGYNGYLVIKGKADLTTGEWTPKKAGDKFFQATLTTVKPVTE